MAVLPALASLCRRCGSSTGGFLLSWKGLQLWGKEAQLPGETRIPDTFMDNPILILIHGGHFRVPAPCWEQGNHEQLPQFPCALAPISSEFQGSWITKLLYIPTNGRCLEVTAMTLTICVMSPIQECSSKGSEVQSASRAAQRPQSQQWCASGQGPFLAL